jgi:hypothetical protein
MVTKLTPRKRARIGRVVIPCLKKCDYYIASHEPKKAKAEVLKARNLLRKEAVSPADLFQHMSVQLHEIAIQFLDDGSFTDAILMLEMSLGYKRRFPQNDNTVSAVLSGLFIAYLYSCNFEKAEEIISAIKAENAKKPNSELEKLVEEYDNHLNTVIKNEPLFSMSEARLTITGQEKISPIGVDIYLPIAFNEIEAEIDNIEVKLSVDKILCTIEFKILRFNQKPYQRDEWKNFSSPFWKTVPEGTSNLILFVDENMTINEQEVEVKELDPFKINTRIGDVFIPNSYPKMGLAFPKNRQHHPATDIIPVCKKFLYFRGKWFSFLWKLESQKRYISRFPIHIRRNNERIEKPSRCNLGFLFPFKHLKVLNTKATIDEDNTLLVSRNLGVIPYFESRSPVGAWAFYFDGKNAIPSPPKPHSLDVTPARKLNLDTCHCLDAKDFSIIQFDLLYDFGKEVIVTARVWKEPLPTGVFSCSVSSQEYALNLIEYTLINSSSEKQTIEIETQIVNGTTYKKSYTVLPMTITNVNCALPFNVERIIQTASYGSYIIRMKAVIRQEKNEIKLLQDEQKITLMPLDVMVFQVINPLTGIIENWSNYLAGWVTPQSKAIKELVGEMIKEQSNLLGYDNNLDEKDRTIAIINQVKTIYDYLQKKCCFSYNNQVVNFGTDQAFFFQSVQLPSITLRNGFGNCIDFSVLFASLLEAVGINPIIALIPGHAFFGWEIWKNSNQYQFLESTCVVNQPFATAFERGQLHMSKAQNQGIEKNNTTPSSLPLLHLVNVAEMRKKGVSPIE